MGTTSQKLTYLNTTKQLLKTEINKINNVLTDESTFRSYPQELFNGYLDVLNNGTDTLWNNLEKVSASGEEATLENVETAPMKMVLNGNTSQDTTTGKNLLECTLTNLKNINILGTWNDNIYTMNDVTFTINDDLSISVNGTASASAYLIINNNLSLINGTEYVISGSPLGSSAAGYSIRLYTGTAYESVYNQGRTFIYDAQDLVRINIFNGTIVNNLTFYPMIRLSSITDDTYEKFTFGASPNPDYPQEVKVVKGENVVSVSGKNKLILPNMTLTMNGVTVTTYEDGRVVINGTATGVVNIIGFVLPNIVSYTNNKQFTYSLFYVSGGATNLNSTTSLMLKKGTVGESSYGDFGGISIKQNNYTENANKLITTIDENSVTRLQFISLYTEQIFDNLTYKLQLEESSTATDFEEYTKTDYPISLGTLELCKIGDYKDYLFKRNGKWYVHKEIGKVVIDENSNVGVYSAPRFKILDVDFLSPSATTKGNILCNKLRAVAKNTLASVNNVISGSDNGKTGEMLVRINAEINTLALFRQFLAENNLTIHYSLATPTEEEITNTTLISQLEAISKAKSVKDKTYITQTNDELPFILECEAIKEYEVN